MNYQLTAPARAIAEISLPASKSISNRALILNALCSVQSHLTNVAICDDTDAMQKALSSTADVVNIGAAGTAMRFLTAYFATQEGRTVTLDGSERMRQRPSASWLTPYAAVAHLSNISATTISRHYASQAKGCMPRLWRFPAM